MCAGWETLVVCPGSTDPVGAFDQCDFDEWESSVRVNFTAQMQVIHELLPFRSLSATPGAGVILFAGGGTNNAPCNYSAYIISKIALIKMCELLDAELPNTRFTILGPGWVKTKIHHSSLRAPARAGANYQRIIDRFNSNNWTPMEAVLDCCDWIVSQPRQTVGGRNFSLVNDPWGTPELEMALLQDQNLYKLRRHGNDRLVKNTQARG
jgi:NAD(P)-dependent dehydrogenase (short-subunit alcohol dehydrogenase family)